MSNAKYNVLRCISALSINEIRIISVAYCAVGGVGEDYITINADAASEGFGTVAELAKDHLGIGAEDLTLRNTRRLHNVRLLGVVALRLSNEANGRLLLLGAVACSGGLFRDLIIYLRYSIGVELVACGSFLLLMASVDGGGDDAELRIR